MTDYCPFCLAAGFVATHLLLTRVLLLVATLAFLVAVWAAYRIGLTCRDSRLQPGFWVFLGALLLPQFFPSTAACSIALVLGCWASFGVGSDVYCSWVRQRERKREWAERQAERGARCPWN